MENIYLEHTEDTPQVNLNTSDFICTITGRSLPENAIAFYLPIIEWLNNFATTSNNDLTFNFKLDYFNTASAKQITKVLLVLQKLAETKNIKINWHYFVDDADIKASGMRFARLIKADIELISYED